MTDVKQRSVHILPHIVGNRFFTVPKLDTPIDAPVLSARSIEPDATETRQLQESTMRYAAYMRISSEEQVGNFSIDAQQRAIEEWIKGQDGTLVRTYIDEGLSGRTADRPQFLQMRKDAKAHKFDAIVVHKLDRFARNRTDALAIKSLLRHDYGVKVLSVSEPTEDSDGPLGALIEGIMESVADWYSRNLAQETAKGKRERALQGYHNNRPPFGYDKDGDGALIPNERELSGLRLAFELYATGTWTDNMLAVHLNQEGYVQKNGKSFNTETIRNILQNRTYLGFVKYNSTKYHSDGSRVRGGQRATSHDDQWLQGRHQPIIDADTFKKCQEIRYGKAVHHEYYPKHRTYLLRDLIYCAHCADSMPENNHDEMYGKMRPHTDHGYMRYRCLAHHYGRECPQGSVHAEDIEAQVVNILKTLKPPENWRSRITEAMGELLGDQKLDERLKEIKDVIARMDLRWDHGFITDQQNYLDERIRLQQELEKLTPIADNDLETAADMLNNFGKHWMMAQGDIKRQQELIQLIVGRIWVRNNHVETLSLRADYHVTVGFGSKTPTIVEVGADENFLHRRSRRASNPRSST